MRHPIKPKNKHNFQNLIEHQGAITRRILNQQQLSKLFSKISGIETWINMSGCDMENREIDSIAGHLKRSLTKD